MTLPMPVEATGSTSAAQPEREIVVGRQYLVQRDGVQKPGIVLNQRTKLRIPEAYVSYVGEDKRLDEWLPVSALGEEIALPGPSRLQDDGATSGRRTPAPTGEDSERSTPEREHDAITRVRNFEDVRFGEYTIKTWYYSPYPMAHDPPAEPPKRGKKRKEPPSNGSPAPRAHLPHVLGPGVGMGGERALGRLWVCDLCFKYMRTRDAWDRHTSGCKQLQPPGRKVYQRDNYTIWEIDGVQAKLYCQNLSLFGKLFIDHKTIFYDVENFLFYVLCDAATSRRDQVYAYFSKEKITADDYNLACIIAFPPFQSKGFGRLLIEFSYYLTRHPTTRAFDGSPGTPERPLSDLGRMAYTAFWAAVIVRTCRDLLAGAPKGQDGRALRHRRSEGGEEHIEVNGAGLTKRPEPNGHYSVHCDLGHFARACHLRFDDVCATLQELGFLTVRGRREASPDSESDGSEDVQSEKSVESDVQDEWRGARIIIDRERVEAAWSAWRVREKVLDERYCLL